MMAGLGFGLRKGLHDEGPERPPVDEAPNEGVVVSQFEHLLAREGLEMGPGRTLDAGPATVAESEFRGEGGWLGVFRSWVDNRRGVDRQSRRVFRIVPA